MPLAWPILTWPTRNNTGSTSNMVRLAWGGWGREWVYTSMDTHSSSVDTNPGVLNRAGKFIVSPPHIPTWPG